MCIRDRKYAFDIDTSSVVGLIAGALTSTPGLAVAIDLSLIHILLSIHDKDAQWWEKLTQYKSVVYWDKEKTLGAPFVMF